MRPSAHPHTSGRTMALAAVLGTLCLLAILCGGGGSIAPAGGQPAATRDPAYWPFEAGDPWNRSLGSGAQYAAIVSPAFSITGGGFMNCTEWSHPIAVATATDPVRRIYRQGRSEPAFTARVPESARPDPEADGHLHVIDETHRYVVEMWQARRRDGGDLEASACVRNDLKGQGIYPEWHGTRAYGGSAIGGLIRKGELRTGIRHALAVAVERAAMNRQGPGGKPYVWPASSADDGHETGYSATGNFHMGSLLAIPPSVNLASIGVGTSGPAYEIARALQDYGAYVVDSAGGNLVFYAEPSAAPEMPGDLTEPLAAVVRHLRLVTNNGPGSIGGGGTPRRPPPPPFDR